MKNKDADIQQDVIDQLGAEDTLEKSTIAVAVKDGIVHLLGSVPTDAERRDAERASHRAAGVKAVVDELRTQAGVRRAVDVFSAVYERRAVRAYADKHVPRERIDQLIDAAIQAPSAMNRQPWEFVAIGGRAKLAGYSERVKAHLLSAGDSVLTEEAAAILRDTAVDVFHGAPVLIVICATSKDAQAAEDCCLAAQNLMLCAHALGIGTCPIGFARPWLQLPEVKREIGIPEHLTPVFPVVAGFAAEQPKNPGRHDPKLISI